MSRHADAAKLTEAQWEEIQSQPCGHCEQPYHRFCDLDPEHDWSATACINALQGRIEDLEVAFHQLLEYHVKDPATGCCVVCQGRGGRWPCETQLEAQAALEGNG